MHQPESPEATIQRQLDAYNACDLDAWLATYAPGATQYVFPAMLMASGIDENSRTFDRALSGAESARARSRTARARWT